MPIEETVVQHAHRHRVLVPRHAVCDAKLEAHEDRVIITHPEDRAWPHDLVLRLPYCTVCRTVFGFDQLTWSEQGRRSMTRTQFWLHPSVAHATFVAAFTATFPAGVARHQPLVADAHPPGIPDGSPFFWLDVPTVELPKLAGFLRAFAEAHRFVLKTGPADGFGYSHSG